MKSPQLCFAIFVVALERALATTALAAAQPVVADSAKGVSEARGVLEDQHGAPVAAAAVEFTELRPRGLRVIAVTDTTGVYRLRLIPGLYWVRITTPHGGELKIDSVRIAPGKVNLHHRVYGIAVRIRVLEGAGKPVSSGALHFDPWPYHGGAYMDTEGFQHRRLVRGEVLVVLPKPGPYLFYFSREEESSPLRGRWIQFRTDSIGTDTTLVFRLN